MMTTRSATSSASSWSCVTNTLVTCISSCSRRSQRRSSFRTFASSAPNGSSSSSTFGFDRQRAGERDALALAAGELRGAALGQHVELHQLQQLMHRLPDLGFATDARARGRTRSPKATFSNTLMWRNRA